MCIVSAFLFFECENENKGLKNMDQVEHQEKIRRQNIDRNMFVFLWTSPYVDYVGGRTQWTMVTRLISLSSDKQEWLTNLNMFKIQ